jgi:hypothetical protein
MPMSTKMPPVVNLRAALEGGSTLNTLRVDLSFGLRAPVINGQPTIQSVWRADLWEVPPKAWTQGRRTPKPRFLGTFVTDSAKEQTPADLLRQVADIYEAGELKVEGVA